jgi:predicted transport protein
MNEDVIADLKQFIAATVSQNTADIRSDMQRLDDKLSHKIDDLSDSVAEAISSSNDTVQNAIDNHELRITTLEQQAA